MKLSVIIPAYNAEKTIKRCIESILSNQIVGEIIVIDDGSRDNTRRIVEEIKKEDDRIFLLQQENSGPAIARKNGIAVAKENYITFVDSDDYVEKKFYDDYCSSLKNEKIDIFEFGFYKVFEEKNEIQKIPLRQETLNDESCLEHYAMQRNTTNYLWNKIFRRELFNKVVWENLFVGEDAVVLTQLFAICNYYKIIAECGYFYVMTMNSLCRSDFSIRTMDNLKAYMFIKKFYAKKRPELVVYIDYKICSISALLYAQCSASNIKIEEKNFYLNELEKTFYMARKNISFKFILSNGSFFRKIMIILFSISPKLCSKIRNKY